MSRVFARVATVLFVLFVAAGLAFGASQALEGDPEDFCGDDPAELDTCPPYTGSSCDEACREAEYFGGGCLPTVFDGDCCTCLT
ncbi:MAG: hypothetical protein ACRELC_12925 [Gemmatimonadota bacterium]